jgi:Sulfotransferase family
MIVSHEHKFIFLKTKKTAGTSIEIALSQLCGPDDIISPITETDEALRADGSGPRNWRVHGWWRSPRPLFKRSWLKVGPPDYGFYNHMPANEVRELLHNEQVWTSYFKFAFDRNPWDRQVSAYHFRYRRRRSPPSFADFIHHDRRARLNNYDIYSLDGEACVNFLGRFENLQEDFRHALSEIGLKINHELPRAKSGIRQNAKHYRDYYDDYTREVVGSWYEREIGLLGYVF